MFKMKYATGLFLVCAPAASAFAPSSKAFVPTKMSVARGTASTVARSMAEGDDDSAFDQEKFIAESKEMRLKHLEEQAMFALKISCENYGNAVFPNAMIAGDVVITHLLDRLGYLKDGKATIMVVDTFHLFPEPLEFLKEIEDYYGFKAEVFCAEGVPVGDKAAFDKKYGANLWKEDIEQYDKVCKVEPFQRGLKTLNTNCMINGRTRWQGFERAWIDQFENAPIGGGLAKCNPLGKILTLLHLHPSSLPTKSSARKGNTAFLTDKIFSPSFSPSFFSLLDSRGHLRLHCEVQGPSPSPPRQGLPLHRRCQGYHPHPRRWIHPFRQLQV